MSTYKTISRYCVSTRKPICDVSPCQKGRELCVKNGIKLSQSTVIQNSNQTNSNVTESKRAYQDWKEQGQIFSDICRRRIFVLENCISFLLKRHFSTSSKTYSVRVDHKKDYYKILGVTPNCSHARVKQAYYRLSKVYHPDVNKSEAAVIKFHEISEAYEILSNISLKHRYDTDRRGHVHHGIHRGVRQHPVNFTAKGPYQYRTSDSYNYDQWLKSHYSEAFKEKERRRRQHAPFVGEPPDNPNSTPNEHRTQKGHEYHSNSDKSSDLIYLVVVILIIFGASKMLLWLRLQKKKIED